MESHARYFLIGLFALAGLAGILAFGWWLAGPGGERDQVYYDVVFAQEVTGLTVGSSVQYNGIQVGQVVRLGFDPNDPTRVVARIRVGRDTPLRESTRAQLGAASLVTGSAYVRLIGDTASGRSIVPDGPEDVPLIIAEQSPLSKLQSEGEAMLSALTALTRQANEFLSSENAERLGATLQNLEQATASLARYEEQLLPEVKDTLNSLHTSASALESLLLQNQPALESGLRGMEDLELTMREFQRTLASFRRLSRQLEEEPSRVLGRGEHIRGVPHEDQ
ncbi:hypothetical protein CAI21_01760 [Alkalilimnicola ehrlichii]|uniref:Mce/MlaD domain-containing protein n=1 Tax=Alkalilimnicola ehrlichii TaxID=351052 RepID=A0A3E0X1J6_9GAMM|nr:MlaD family protein [Alkalilimnicola ehrlichii]RFA31369.1 hypothetical protein CAI21_01760 [Alkalilimnicola ehrlichii]RFA39357.1 hypothetical protein CAL65_00645 [Alkalilimnicola ehrlichii]